MTGAFDCAGELLANAIEALAAYDVGAITIMHTATEMIDDCLEVATHEWPGVIGVYAHSGDYVNGDWIFDGVISPTEYQAAARNWIDRGVLVIGGCCGIGPDHVRALAELR